MAVFSRAKTQISPITFMLLSAFVLTGCTLTPTPQKPSTAPDSIISELQIADSSVPEETPSLKHIRYNRYTVMSTSPKPDQTNLLSQIIDIRIPDALTPSVQDAMTYILRRSGYQLCPADSDVQLLYSHALPASHYQLGPITLRDALQVLAGSAWELNVDELTRSICFSMQPGLRRPAPALSPALTFPAATQPEDV
jgi:type IV pili sensor histidine kinase/response regulator